MKIAILTQPLHINYGGNLQNFALQKVLKDMGHEPVTIDRHHTIKLRAKLKLGYIKGLVLHYLKGVPKPLWRSYFISKKQQNYIQEDIVEFITSHINKTPRLYSDEEVEAVFEQQNFDSVIVGSDQCWRPMYSPNIYTYFLDFLENNETIKKIAYAASFGTDSWEYSKEQETRCQALIQQFDLITVREKSAVNLVKDNFNKEAGFVLDPTLLLSKDDYSELFDGKDLPNNKGIYTYILDNNDWKDKVVETAKTTLGLPQFSNQHNEQHANTKKIPSIEGWIKGIADADFVITDSFHGTVFSIIYNKPFISLANVGRGASRFQSLLGEIGLLDRLVDKYDQQEILRLILEHIETSDVIDKLNKLKIKSLNLLKISLQLENDN